MNDEAMLIRLNEILENKQLSFSERHSMREAIKRFQASPPSGGEVCIGEVRENGVVWFGQNPHAHPIGTRFYTSPRVVDDDMLDAACEAYADMYDVEYIDGNNRDNRRACIKAALQAALEAK